ncbi:MAG: c-type cytochrome [Nitrospira sp. CR1.2]|nr:c-type cytochrome [Nitrospira sp. CR1.2]
MHAKRLKYIAILIITGLCASTAQAVKPTTNRDSLREGRRIYEQACAWCHGTGGEGDGPAGWFIGRYSSPRPRNFAQDGYKFRSTGSGDLPTDQDLFTTITRGIPGVMPAYRALNERERWQVIAYLKSWNPAFEEEKPVPLTFPQAPAAPTEAAIHNGRNLYVKYDCRVCHGDNGEGDGPEATAGHLRDGNNLPIRATNLTDPSAWKNGASALDLFRTLTTGLDGTPMPSYANEFAGREEALWELVWYIQSLSDQQRK